MRMTVIATEDQIEVFDKVTKARVSISSFGKECVVSVTDVSGGMSGAKIVSFVRKGSRDLETEPVFRVCLPIGAVDSTMSRRLEMMATCAGDMVDYVGAARLVEVNGMWVAVSDGGARDGVWLAVRQTEGGVVSWCESHGISL